MFLHLPNLARTPRSERNWYARPTSRMSSALMQASSTSQSRPGTTGSATCVTAPAASVYDSWGSTDCRKRSARERSLLLTASSKSPHSLRDEPARRRCPRRRGRNQGRKRLAGEARA
ncbi:hypothetical protein GUJ93_ZPchr0006g45642 [Zizania palustris]|uniref:Uncharacterized protein n=1 Tax=Zizania palustris TaxID=103762 RepID=A0A8J5S7K3_ZIZPA|nr:hypothetical protein GUJ93_ZPchr0006g45642 [Zizania palustris]